MSTSTPEELPSSPHLWKCQAIHCGLQGGTVFDLDKYHSASKIDFKQFLHLRALWIPAKQEDFADPKNRQTWLADAYYEQAKKRLKGWKPWESYLKTLKQTREQLYTGMFPQLGTFSLVRHQQLDVDRCKGDKEPTPKFFSPVRYQTRLRSKLQQNDPFQRSDSPTPGARAGELNLPQTPVNLVKYQNLLDDIPSSLASESARSDFPESMSPISADMVKEFPAADDEQIVNSALVLFLNAVVIHFVRKADWTLHRKIFRIGKSNKRNKEGFEARVDGFLRRHFDDKVMAIVETKACVREAKEADIQMQETAQMAAWISTFPENVESDASTNFM
jgi:hypothetical protein